MHITNKIHYQQWNNGKKASCNSFNFCKGYQFYDSENNNQQLLTMVVAQILLTKTQHYTHTANLIQHNLHN